MAVKVFNNWPTANHSINPLYICTGNTGVQLVISNNDQQNYRTTL